MAETFEAALKARLQMMADAGLSRDLITLPAPGVHQEVGGRPIVSFASNDYLGLCAQPLNISEAPGSGASRLVVGNLEVHDELEGALAAYVGLEASLLFTSGYAANVGTIPALVGPGDVIFSDRLNHASLIDGARLSGAEIVVFPHRDLEALKGLLETHRGAGSSVVLTEAVFSMDGDSANLRELSRLCQDAGAWLYVDEAHSLGLLGAKGAGLCASHEIEPDVLLGTLGKSFGTQGAFVAGSAHLRRWLIHKARSFVFSTGLSPYVSRATLDRLEMVRQADTERAHALGLAASLRRRLRSSGHDVRGDDSAISSVVLGAPERAVKVAAQVLEAGFLARAIRPPTVPEGTSRIRIVTSAAHTVAQVDGLVQALERSITSCA